jgi:hypothetical protein
MFVPQAPPSFRTCGRCGQPKPIEDFAWRRQSRGQRDNYCRPCRAAYKREHYAKHHGRYIENAKQRKRATALARVERLLEIFRKRPCADCGETDPLVLEFDHVGDKRFNIAKGIRDLPWPTVLDEIARCEVVCANCHRRRTAHRAGFARAVVAQR